MVVKLVSISWEASALITRHYIQPHCDFMVAVYHAG